MNKSNRLINLSVILTLCFLYSCNKNNKIDILDSCDIIATRQIVNNDTVIVCDYSSATSTIQVPLSTFFDSLSVIKLDKEEEEALIGHGFPKSITDNYIGIKETGNQSPYKLFSKQGKFIGKVGSIGQGPGEYNNICSSQIDEQNNRIYLLPWNARQILVYDLQGLFLESIPLSYLIPKGHFYVDFAAKRISLVETSFDNTIYPTIWVQDFEGNIIHEINYKYMQVFPDFANEPIINNRTKDILNFSFLRSYPVNDSVYTYKQESNDLIPTFTANFDDYVPLHSYKDLNNYFIVEVYGNNTDPKTMHLYTSMIVDKVIVDKNTLKGAHYKMFNDFLGGIHLENALRQYGSVMSEELGFAICIEPGGLLELIDERLSEKISDKYRDFLTSWKEQISDDDNNYVIWGKMKE